MIDIYNRSLTNDELKTDISFFRHSYKRMIFLQIVKTVEEALKEIGNGHAFRALYPTQSGVLGYHPLVP